jgi:hypothetical protein
MKHALFAALLAASALSSPALAQEHQHHDGMDMSGMDMPPDSPSTASRARCRANFMGGWGDGKDEPFSYGTICAYSDGSGTARLPGNDGDPPGLHIMSGDWMLMAHATASLQYTKATGPRGDDKTYATSMAMLMAERDTDWGKLQLRAMASLEPAMDPSGYPNLFATGETAHGLPIVDRQHPHDLFMELAARVDFNVADNTTLFVYGGPVGEPAIAHHWFDSTHITYGVVTAGLAGRTWQIEASVFRGQEPDERRWNIETPKLDSWSVRATLNPAPSWAVQASYGQIKQPESTHPGEDEHRFTASAHFASTRGFSAMAAFSAKQRVPGDTLTAWLGEANWNLDAHNTLFGRIENVANDELFPDHAHPLHDMAFRVTKFQAGYARRVPLGPVELAVGGSLAAYAKPAAFDAYYGANPMGYTLFARLTLVQ